MAVGFKNRTTPGVYITELDAFPPSIVGVQTAVPAFIGYTEKAEINGKQSFNKPIRVGSMADFEEYFGKQYQPQYDIVAAPISSPPDYKYDFRVAVTNQSSPPVSPMPPSGWDYFYLKQVSASKFNLYDSMRLFYANGGGNCYVVSVGDYSKAISLTDLNGGLNVIAGQVGPTMLVIPDAVLLPPKTSSDATASVGTGDKPVPPYVEPTEVSTDFQNLVYAMLKQCANLQDRIAILDVYNTLSVVDDNTLNTTIQNFHSDVADEHLNYGMAYFPFLVTSVVQATDFDFTNFTSDGLSTLQKILYWETENLYPLPKTTSPPDPNSKHELLRGYINGLPALSTQYNATPTDPTVQASIKTTNQNLSMALPLYGKIVQIMVDMNSVLPPSAAMAGVYTYIDGTRGVWNAPANIDLTGVVQTTYKLSDPQQGELNVPVDGKAVNAIREFIGRGSVVWGARTLDGNSNDWKYIQVRRTLIYVEQSIKLALNQFVFAANDANTWATVVAMVSNFLGNLWAQGGLMGDKATDAFTVQCGLGSTMTGMDILSGYMVVQVTLQMIHPAEFIELTFKQQMQGVS
jgi:phage tail sheath protein FI